MTAPHSRPLRYAVYTRVSTDAGLEQDFYSLDAQREACERYIKSQTHEGWKLLKPRFDDGGFSGGNMERPALQALLDEIRERRLDIVVVYKVDRLTRSLVDFAKLVELFDANGVSFVSVTQSFNTTTSMGRLTLNVLLSFAQFEREVTGERIRDKIAASKKKGLWMGGVVPLGYMVKDRKPVVVPEEAETVRLIFDRYRELRSLPILQRDLRERGVVTRRRTLATGRKVGGIPFLVGALVSLLRNRTYIGEINHRGESYPGEHDAIFGKKRVGSCSGDTGRQSPGTSRALATLRGASDWQAVRRPRQSHDAELRHQTRRTLSLLRFGGGGAREHGGGRIGKASCSPGHRGPRPRRAAGIGDSGRCRGRSTRGFSELRRPDHCLSLRDLDCIAGPRERE